MALDQRAVLVGCGNDLQLAAVIDQPAPTGTKLLGRGFVELLFEVFEAAKVLLDLFGDLAGGLSSALGLHDLPEHGVVDMAAAVVADGCRGYLPERCPGCAINLRRNWFASSGCFSMAAFRLLT